MVFQGADGFDRFWAKLNSMPFPEKVGFGIIVALCIFGIVWVGIAIYDFIDRQRSRKRILKATEKLEKTVSSALKELTDYKDALGAFIKQYNADKTQVSPALEAFKLQITRFALPKIDPASFEQIRILSYVNPNGGAHHKVFYKAVMLGGFCNLYREFLAHDNRHHLTAIETLIGSFYHSSSLKPHVEYMAEKVPTRDADHAIRYFTDYARVIDEAFNQTTALKADLKPVLDQNRKYLAIVTVGI